MFRSSWIVVVGLLSVFVIAGCRSAKESPFAPAPAVHSTQQSGMRIPRLATSPPASRLGLPATTLPAFETSRPDATESLPGSAAGFRVVAVREMGPMEQLPVIQGRDGCISALSNGKSKWVYGDTVMKQNGVDGSNWRDNTTSWTTDLDASNLITGFAQDSDSLGVPYEFLPHTADELLFNQRMSDPGCVGDSCGYEFALWPGQVVPDPARNRTLYFFGKIYRNNSIFIGDGTGIDVQIGDDPLTRPILRPTAADPTLMWDINEPAYGSGYTVVNDTLYAYAPHLNFLSQDISVARVPLADVLTRDAWRYYAGNGVWSADINAGVIIFSGGSYQSVHWNPYVGKYLAIYSRPLSNKIMLRAADRPEGPWTQEVLLLTGKKPGIANSVDYFGMAHPEYEGSGGRYDYVGYYHPTGFLAGETRIVQIEFGPKAAATLRSPQVAGR